ncbi:MAG: hypothetical protein R3E13_02800 [Alphaproteobacteria bacterium]
MNATILNQRTKIERLFRACNQPFPLTSLFNRLFHIIVFITLCLFVASCAQEESLDSWEASTIEECIQEKACAWRAFKETVLDAHGLWEHSNKRAKIAKWQDDINVGFWDDVSADTKEIVLEAKRRIEPYFPYGVDIKKPANFIILPLKNFEKKTIDQFHVKMKSDLKMTDEQYMFFTKYVNAKDRDCAYFRKKDELISDYLVLVNITEKTAPKCVYTSFYYSMNISYHGLLKLHLNDYPIEQESLEKITDLHLVILKVFYNAEFPEIVDYHSGKQAFLNIYPKVLKEYNAAKTGE